MIGSGSPELACVQPREGNFLSYHHAWGRGVYRNGNNRLTIALSGVRNGKRYPVAVLIILELEIIPLIEFDR